MKNRKFIRIIAGISLIFILGIITNYYDSGRVTTGHEPKYCLKIVSNDGKKITYWGLGYKVIRYVGGSPNEPYENNIGVKMGSWFMKYELSDDEDNQKNPKEIQAEDINDYIIDYMSKNSKDNYVYSYVDIEKNKVIVGLIKNTKEKQQEFIHNIFSQCCGKLYIKYIEDNSMIEFRTSKYIFEAKIIETKNDLLTVEVLKDTEQVKKGYKVTTKTTKPSNGTNDYYVKGNIVRITFNNIEKSNSEEMSVIEIELIK